MDIGKYSFVNRTTYLWNQLPAEALATSPCKSLIFRKRVRKVIISEEKWTVLEEWWQNGPKVQGSEKWGVKCEVKWSEVMILGEMCVLSLIFCYVTLCRFCVVHNLLIIWFSSLFSNYLTYVFQYSFLCLFSVL